MIGGPKGPPSLIEEVLSGRSTMVVQTREEERRNESGRRAIN